METPDRRLLICEEALKNFNGHWYEYDKAVVEMNRAVGVEVELLAHAKVDATIQDELNARPYFSHTNWDGLYYHPSPWRRYAGILHHNWRVWRSMRRYFSTVEDPIDCVFVPTVVIFHLIAWWFLAWSGKAKRIVLLIRNSATTYDSDSIHFSATARVLGFVLRRLARFEKVKFATDSHRLANEYHQLADIDMTVLPHPCLLSDGSSPAGTTETKPMHFISPGPARYEKGAHLLLDAMDLVSPEVRCTMQWPDPVRAPNGTLIEPRTNRCAFLTEPLSSEDYSDFLQSSTCIVLPYLREAYYARISGVAVEAMRLGIPVIYTEDTWIADIVGDFGAGLGFASGDVGALAERIETMAANPVEWRKKALAKSEAAQAHFSSENFQNRLWNATTLTA